LENVKDETERGVTLIRADESAKFVPYQSLYERSLQAAQWLSSEGLSKGDELIVAAKDNENFLYLFWGCLQIGAIPVPISIDASRSSFMFANSILSILSSRFAATDSAALCEWLKESAFEPPLAKVLLASQEALDEFSGNYAKEDPKTLDSDVACVLFSSGSTSLPKGVGLTNHAFDIMVSQLAERLNVDSGDSALNWMPLTHTFALTGIHLTAIAQNINQYLLQPEAFLKNPMLWLKSLSARKVTITTSTNFALNYALRVASSRQGELAGSDFSSLYIYVSGEPISYPILHSFYELFKEFGLRKNALMAGYGMTEATASISAPHRGEAFSYVSIDRNCLQLGEPIKICEESDPNSIYAVGNNDPLPWASLRIADESNSPYEEGVLGVIWLKGEAAISEYYRANASALADGWLNTGDIGFYYGNQLYITARYKNMFIFNSKNLYYDDLEAAISNSGVAENTAWFVGFREKQEDINDTVVCFLLSNADDEALVDRAKIIQKQIRLEYGLRIETFIPIDSPPQTSSGKLQRFKLLENYLSGGYGSASSEFARKSEALYEPIDKQSLSTEGVIIESFQQEIGIAPERDTFFDELDITSKELTLIFMRLEAEYKGLFDVAELFEFMSVPELAAFIDARAQTQGA
jgi:polyketide synthase PksJ